MFYPVELDCSDRSRIEQALVVLNPAESKRLLAKTVVSLPEVTSAYANGRLVVSSGTTCAFVLEELTGEKIAPFCYSVGFIAEGLLTRSQKDDREAARFFVKGERVVSETLAFYDTFEKGDAAIKGANAIDPTGVAGVLSSNNQSGTIGALQSFLVARGCNLIMPVGLEKLVPDVIGAAAGWGQLTVSHSTGFPCYLYPVSQGLVLTEIEALGVLAGVKARLVASGGIGGSEGAVVLLLEGYAENMEKAWQAVESVKGEPVIEAPRHDYCTL
jgi:hypothetical protein